MKVAIVGYGSEGAAAYDFYKNQGADITIFDESDKPKQKIPSGANVVLGENAFDNIKDYDLVVRFPGVRPDRLKTDGVITSVTREFFRLCPAEIIGITGTKGKGTTSTLIKEILEKSGKKVHLVGNIGVPAITKLSSIHKDDIVVYELSSFQLWDLAISPHVAVVLRVEPDHQDIHANMDEYVGTKANIAKWQKSSDVVIFHPGNEFSCSIASESPGTKRAYLNHDGAYVKDDFIWYGNLPIIPVQEVGLLGAHNLENICAAITAAWVYTQDVSSIARAVTEFKGLPHRIEYVATINQVDYYNDSYSSAPSATVAAIKSFTQPKVLILGGYDRGIDFSVLASEIFNSTMRKVLLIGQSRHRLADALSKVGFKDYEIIDTTLMKQIVEQAKEASQAGDVVVLSPGCASFDMFKNFTERGDEFKLLVKKL